MSDPVKASDFAAADIETLRLVLDESDKRIQSQVAFALASDARANGLLAAAAALAAAGVAVLAEQMKDAGFGALFWASATFLALELAATGFAIASLWPIGVNPTGWSPLSLREDVAGGKPLMQMYAEIAALNQEKLDENRAAARRTARWTRGAMIALAAGPFAGALAGAVVPNPPARPGQPATSPITAPHRRDRLKRMAREVASPDRIDPSTSALPGMQPGAQVSPAPDHEA